MQIDKKSELIGYFDLKGFELVYDLQKIKEDEWHDLDGLNMKERNWFREKVKVIHVGQTGALGALTAVEKSVVVSLNDTKDPKSFFTFELYPMVGPDYRQIESDMRGSYSDNDASIRFGKAKSEE